MEDFETRLRNLEEQSRKDHEEIEAIKQLLERVVLNIRALRLRIVNAPQTISISGEILPPTNDCQKCLGSDGKPSMHVIIDGASQRCECFNSFILAQKLYKEQVAKNERRKKRQENVLRAANKRAKLDRS
jgi:hypothetical protein